MLTPLIMDKSPSHVVSVVSAMDENLLLVIRNLENRIGELEQQVASFDGRVGAAATHSQVDAILAAQSTNITEALNTLNMNMIAYVNDLFASAAGRDEMQNLFVSSRDEMRSSLAQSRDFVNTLIEASTVSLREMLNAMNTELIAYIERRMADAKHEQIDALLAAQTKNTTEMLNALNTSLIAYADGLFAASAGRDEMLSRLAQSQASVTGLVEASTASLRDMLNTMNSDLLTYTERRLAEFAEEQYQLLMQSRRAAFSPNGWVSGGSWNRTGQATPPKRKDHAPALQDVFASLARRAPAAWPLFKQALDIGTRSYEGFPVGSCSVDGHREAERFGAFIYPYLRGYVLDVGCGPQPIPSYLSGYPTELIRGIDPISTADEHPFEFVSAVAEDIPWEEASFDVVCSGTTLDHFFLLDVALREIRRVLKPGGHFVAWISEAPGSELYDPYGERLTQADEEHLFHIDRAWFLPVMHELAFEEIEILSFSVPFKHLFMSFRKPGA
jgi:SAM-dependent methyltransferase/uncharacterized protein YehS (DUF1456 family)